MNEWSVIIHDNYELNPKDVSVINLCLSLLIQSSCLSITILFSIITHYSLHSVILSFLFSFLLILSDSTICSSNQVNARITKRSDHLYPNSETFEIQSWSSLLLSLEPQRISKYLSNTLILLPIISILLLCMVICGQMIQLFGWKI